MPIHRMKDGFGSDLPEAEGQTTTGATSAQELRSARIAAARALYLQRGIVDTQTTGDGELQEKLMEIMGDDDRT